MKNSNLFSDLAELVSEKNKESAMKKIKREKEKNEVIPLKKQKFNCLNPMVKKTITDLMKALRIRGRLFNLSDENNGNVNLCYANGPTYDRGNRILRIKDDGSFFSVILGNDYKGDQTTDLSQKSLVEALRNSHFVEDKLSAL